MIVIQLVDKYIDELVIMWVGEVDVFVECARIKIIRYVSLRVR